MKEASISKRRSFIKLIKSGVRSPSLRDVLYVGGVQLATLLVPLVTGPWLLRALQPNAFGKYALALAIVQFGIIIVDFGFLLSATQHIAKISHDHVEVTKYFWTVQAARVILMLVSAPAIIGLVLAVPGLRPALGVASAYLPVLAGTLLFPQWLFLGLERVRTLSVVNIAARLMLIPVIIIFVKRPSDAAIAAFLAGSSYLISGAICVGLIVKWKLITGFFVPPFKSVIEVFKDSYPLFVSNIAFSLYSTCNTVILGVVRNPYEVGLFSAADKVRFAAETPSRAISTVFFPRISKTLTVNREKALSQLAVLTVLLGTGGIVTCAILYSLSDSIMRLFAGATFGGSVSVLKILSFVGILVGINFALGTLAMVNLGMKREFSRIVVVSGLVNIAILLWLGTTYGANGAAISVLVTEVLVCLLMIVALHRGGFIMETIAALRAQRRK